MAPVALLLSAASAARALLYLGGLAGVVDKLQVGGEFGVLVLLCYALQFPVQTEVHRVFAVIAAAAKAA